MDFMMSKSCEKAFNIINSSYEVYVVGGAIRDYFLNKTPSDYDLVTSAGFDELSLLFKDYKCVKYKKNNTFGVIIDHEMIEISSFKGNSIYDDLELRDFSINSIAYHPDRGFIDPFGGIEDIKNKIIKCNINPFEIISNDPLRMLRAIRFASILSFNIDDNLSQEIKNNYDLISNVSFERIGHELSLFIVSNKPSKYIREYVDLFSVFIPELKNCLFFNQHNKKWHHLDVFEHIMVVLDSTKPNLTVRLAALFHDIEKPNCFTLDEDNVGHFYEHYIKSAYTAQRILSKLKFNKGLIKDVFRLIYFHDRPIKLSKRIILNFLHDYNNDNIEDLFDLKEADIKGQNPDLIYRLHELDEIKEYAYKLKMIYPLKLEDLAINGEDLKKLGYANKMIKLELEHVLELIFDDKINNDKEDIISYLKKHINKYSI